MKKKIILYSVIALVVFAIFFAGYVAAWIQTKDFAVENYNKAEEALKAGKYLDALNGYQIFDAKLQKYVTYVGFTQISTMFEDNSIFGIPPVVEKARKEVMKLIATMPTSDLETYFQNTVRNRNPYILYVLAELIHRTSDQSKISMYENIFSLVGGKTNEITKYYDTLHREAGQ
ncbi:DUF1467 family protein [Athalassotoga saccharophila]|uniref:DUF1467 family protein n=1 Tax=Athalassotoga saccharophila TaxID=1441386 RepID=UPI0013793EBF|nr:DUF1467 family protein [Athalassotoga saccharophila]BBJ28155.1 hypothetical protein ATHSA_1057 [Athalassotoga saccharophila]